MIALLSAFMPAVLVTIIAPAPAQAEEGCLSNGICWRSQFGATTWEQCLDHGGEIEVELSGQPKVSDDYIATHYNVLLDGGRQFERNPFQDHDCFIVPVGTVVSVQGCRYRTVWFGSRCNRWENFTVPRW